MVSQLTYREQSRAFLEQAHSELQAGDLRQASEKGWGAAAQIVKAAAEARGWPHDQHRLLLRAVTGLVQEQGDREIEELFAAARYLHENFYEGEMDERGVAAVLEQVTRLVDKLEALPPQE